MRDTGVRFEDIAGMEFLVTEMREIVRMLKGDEAYKRVGAKCPKVRPACELPRQRQLGHGGHRYVLAGRCVCAHVNAVTVCQLRC